MHGVCDAYSVIFCLMKFLKYLKALWTLPLHFSLTFCCSGPSFNCINLFNSLSK